jgi:hypothetical protein
MYQILIVNIRIISTKIFNFDTRNFGAICKNIRKWLKFNFLSKASGHVHVTGLKFVLKRNGFDS